tara:strand:- start:2 stop:157 length:156 start_codon:yes stop_codon:yes gene_type:complete
MYYEDLKRYLGYVLIGSFIFGIFLIILILTKDPEFEPDPEWSNEIEKLKTN